MAYLIQNTRTDDFIDEHGEWTMIRSFAKKFPSKLDAERWIAKNGIDDYPPIYKIVTESTHHRSFKKFVESKKVIKEETSYEGDVINVAFDNAKITGQEFDDIYDSGFNIGKVYTWTQLEPMMIHARIPSSKIQRVKDELKKLEQMGKYDDFIYEGCKKKSVKEDVEQKVVIHTKNGKVDSIEQGTYMPNGVFIRNAGHNFDKGFIGMDPQDAKASLIKYAKFSPEKIIIEDSKVVLHTKNGIVDYVEKDKQIEGPYDAEFLKHYNVNKGVIGMKPDAAKASLIKSGYKPEQIIVEDNSWTTADGSKIEVKRDKVFKTTKDGKKFWMPRYTWEHAFDGDGDIENGPSRREPTWFPVK